MKKSCSEMEVIREIEKAVLIGLKKEGCQRAAKDCELCPLAVWVENESRYLCKPADLLGTVKGWQRDEKKREEKKKMKEVTWSEDQTMKQESGGFVYRVPLGRGYEVSILSTAYSYGGREGLYEIALADADGEPVNIRGQVKGFEGDEVLGWLTERQVREYIKVLGDFVWHHKGLDAEQIKRQLWTEKWMGRNAWSKIIEEMHERKWQAFEDDKAELFLNSRKAGPMKKIGL